MMRTGLLGLVVSGALVGLIGCKSNHDAPAKPAGQAEKPAAPEPRIPGGPLPVALPTLDAKYARRIQAATAFVTVDKDGALASGQLAPGPTPYNGTRHGDAPLVDEVFPPAVASNTAGSADPTAGSAAIGAGSAVATADPDPAPEPAPPAKGKHKMKGNKDPQLARQQAIDQARSAGILGMTTKGQGGAFATLTGSGDLDDVNIYGGLLGNEVGELAGRVELTAARETIGALDAIVLADAWAPAPKALQALLDLGDHRSTLAVEGTGAPDGVQYRFAPPHAGVEPPAAAVRVVFDSDGSLDVRSAKDDAPPIHLPATSGSAAIDQLAAALRPDPLVPVAGLVELSVEDQTTVQQLVDALGACAAVAVNEIRIVSPMHGFGGGWGTIGTGQYGTIGHGSGNAYGVGSRPDGPRASIGQPTSVGDLDKAIIRRYIKRSIQKITYCYEKQLLADPKLEGTVTANFYIGPSGKVETSSAAGVDPEVSACVARVIEAIEFPKPKGGGGVQVSYPLTFRPAP